MRQALRFLGIGSLWSRRRVGMLAGWLVVLGAALAWFVAAPTPPGNRSTAAGHDPRFETPETTIHTFRDAVRHGRWRDEYECYAGPQRARFTYHLMVSTRELDDAADLAMQRDQAFLQHRVPPGLLERFPSLHSTFAEDSDDPTALDAWMQRNARLLESQHATWEREVQPLDIDWAGLIQTLQPLFIENFRRHVGQDHPSQYGIVCQLDCHTFDRVWDLYTDGDHASGTIVARFRDTNVMMDAGEILGSLAGGILGSHGTFNWRNLASSDAWWGRAGRSSERISLVRQENGWKIDAVPRRHGDAYDFNFIIR